MAKPPAAVMALCSAACVTSASFARSEDVVVCERIRTKDLMCLLQFASLGGVNVLVKARKEGADPLVKFRGEHKLQSR